MVRKHGMYEGVIEVYEAAAFRRPGYLLGIIDNAQKTSLLVCCTLSLSVCSYRNGAKLR